MYALETTTLYTLCKITELLGRRLLFFVIPLDGSVVEIIFKLFVKAINCKLSNFNLVILNVL